MTGSAEQANQALKAKLRMNFSKLRDAFRKYDEDHDGHVDESELMRGCALAGVELSLEEAKRLMKMFDKNGDGKISNAEFMAHFGDKRPIHGDNKSISNALISGANETKTANRGGTTRILNTDELVAVIRKKLHDMTLSGQTNRQGFRKFDADSSGAISEDEFVKVLKSWGINLSPLQAQKLMDTVDDDGSGHVDFREFVDSIMDGKSTSTVWGVGLAADGEAALKKRAASFAHLDDVFRHYDVKKKGFLSATDVRQAIEHAGVRLSKAEMRKLFQKIDKDGDGQISNADFVHFLGGSRGDNHDDIPNMLAGNGGGTSLQYDRGTAAEAHSKLIRRIESRFQNVNSAFQDCDTNKDGRMSIDELRKAANRVGVGLDAAEAQKLMRSIDTNHDGMISSEEFRAAFDILNAVRIKMRQLPDGATGVKRLFRNFDANHNGCIDKLEFKKVLNHMGIHVPMQQVEQAMERLDKDRSGQLDYNEFIEQLKGRGSGTANNASLDSRSGTAVDARKALLSRIELGFKKYRDAFHHYDEDGDGVIDINELRGAAEQTGVSLSTKETQKLMDKIDTNKDGKIQCAEFLHFVNGSDAVATSLVGSKREPTRPPARHNFYAQPKPQPQPQPKPKLKPQKAMSAWGAAAPAPAAVPTPPRTPHAHGHAPAPTRPAAAKQKPSSASTGGKARYTDSTLLHKIQLQLAQHRRVHASRERGETGQRGPIQSNQRTGTPDRRGLIEQLGKKWRRMAHLCSAMDERGLGKVSKQQLKQVLEQCDVQMSKEQLRQFWDEFSGRGSAFHYRAAAREIAVRNAPAQPVFSPTSSAQPPTWASKRTITARVVAPSSPRDRALERKIHATARQYSRKQQQQRRVAPNDFVISDGLKHAIAQKWKPVWKAFLRVDPTRSGILSPHEVRKVLLSFGIKLPFCDIVSLPRKGDQQILYKRFVKECIQR